MFASGSASPKSTLPLPSTSASTPLASRASFVPYSAVLVRNMKLPGCFIVLPFGSFRSNGTAFSGSSPEEPASMITS
jgi:hypothetical protein